MLGLSINIYLVVIAILSFSGGISFFINCGAPRYMRHFAMSFSFAVFLMCFSYSIMGFFPKTETSYIPRFFGLFGIDSFLLMELYFMYFEMKSSALRFFFFGFMSLFTITDLIVYGNKNVHSYVRFDYYTSYEVAEHSAKIFHNIFIIVMAVVLLNTAIVWYKTKKIEREKHFAKELILGNFLIILMTIPESFGITSKYPTFLPCTAFFCILIVWHFTFKKRSHYMLTTKNVCSEIFETVDIPIFIFNVSGKVKMLNSCAQREFRLNQETDENCECFVRDLFDLSDVEVLRIIAKAKQGRNSKIIKKSKIDGRTTLLKFAAKLDFVGEPFCIICTVEFEDVFLQEGVK